NIRTGFTRLSLYIPAETKNTGPVPFGTEPVLQIPLWSHCMHTEAVDLHRASLVVSELTPLLHSWRRAISPPFHFSSMKWGLVRELRAKGDLIHRVADLEQRHPSIPRHAIHGNVNSDSLMRA